MLDRFAAMLAAAAAAAVPAPPAPEPDQPPARVPARTAPSRAIGLSYAGCECAAERPSEADQALGQHVRISP